MEEERGRNREKDGGRRIEEEGIVLWEERSSKKTGRKNEVGEGRKMEEAGWRRQRRESRVEGCGERKK